jgi:predicted AlkP superfamily phosphohydrolase/phosphomutase
LLVLDEQPLSSTTLEKLNVNWAKSKAWAEGNADIFFNVKGREPQGIVPADELEALRQDLKLRFDALTDQSGRRLCAGVSKPSEIYRSVTNVTPDLMIHFDSNWRSIDSVGHGGNYLLQNDLIYDACGYSTDGLFVLYAPNNPLAGEYQGASLLDMAPTLLDLGGYEIPKSMQGKSLVAGMEKKSGSGLSESDEKLIHDRLAGLGYV